MSTNDPLDSGPAYEEQASPTSASMDEDAMALAEQDLESTLGFMQSSDDAEALSSAEKQVAAAAREERLRLLPEYLENYFLEDLPPINPDDPFNQGIYMRFRINQMRQAKDMEPVE